MTTMRPYITLTKQCKRGVSEWTFGLLSNGWFAAKQATTGEKMFFRTNEKMQACITRFIFKYGFSAQQSATQLVIKGLASVA